LGKVKIKTNPSIFQAKRKVDVVPMLRIIYFIPWLESVAKYTKIFICSKLYNNCPYPNISIFLNLLPMV
jgi:hypothetical protein